MATETQQKKYKKTLKIQLKKFKEDKSYFDLYDCYEFNDSVYLLRLFEYIPPTELQRASKLLIPVPGSPGEFKYGSEVIGREMFPIAKIIKVGSQMVDYHGTPIKTAPYKAGDIVALPPAKVMGERPNPMYEHWLRTSASLGVDVQTDPPPTIITNIDENYAEYQWTRLGNIEPDEQDQKTYLLSSYEVRGHFDMDKFLTK